MPIFIAKFTRTSSERGSVEIEADCEADALAIAEEMAEEDELAIEWGQPETDEVDVLRVVRRGSQKSA